MSFLPSYTHIVNPKLKHIYLSFDERGNLVIKSPKVSHKRIEQLLLKKASWITKSREKLEEKKGKALDFSQGLELYYKGKAYPLGLVVYEKKRTKLVFDGEKFTIFYSHYDEALFQKHIDLFYKKEAQLFIPEYVSIWAKTMGLKPKNIAFRKTKRQWGSCSSRNDLSFNTMMMKLPQDMIQYIIVHELAHITHKHHQKAFWGLVQKYLPEYKTQVKALKAYTT
jgi:predicted metal-dependent hydrolase